MAMKIADALVHLGVTDKALRSGLQSNEKVVRNWTTKASGIIVKGLAVVGTAAAALLTGAAVAAGKAAFAAMPIEGIRDAFRGLTGDAGETMQALREGALGMVKDAELMASYNTATQLVSKSFADDLPDAMKYLSKVSAATGADMGYMIDSLVKGVGRLSPLILDNLQVQVTLTQATARATDMFGLQADQLSKTQIQAGMMNVVMEKLAANTAKMPEVTGTAAHVWGVFQTKLANAKDLIGLALLPALRGLLTLLGGLVDEYLPPVVAAFEEKLGPALEKAVTWLGKKLPDAIGVAGNIIQWIRDHIEELKPVTVAMGTTAAVAFGIWAVNAGIAAAATVAATWPLLAIGAAVGVLYAAWVNDWGGIRTSVVETWEQYLRPIFNYISTWLGVHLPQALEVFREWWERNFAIGLRIIAEYIRTDLAEAFETFRVWLQEHLPQAVAVAWLAINALTMGLASLVYWIAKGTKPTIEGLTKDVYALAMMFQAAFPPVVTLTEGTRRWAGGMVDAFLKTKTFIGGLKAFYDEARSKTIPVLGALTEGLSILAPEAVEPAKVSFDDLVKTLDTNLPAAAEKGRGKLREIAAVLRQLAQDWVPTLARVFGVRMHEMFEDAKNIRSELEELFTIGGVFGGLARAAVSMLEARTLKPLQESLKEITAEMNKFLKGSPEYLALWEKREQVAASIAEHEERITSLQERQMELGFLQQQVELLKLIEDYDLNLEDILGGMALGIKANAADVLDAMVRALQEVIGVVEEELGIESPSKVFARLAEQAMQGFAQGILEAAAVPAGALSQVTTTMTRTVEQSFYIERQAYPRSTDSELRADIRFLRFAGAGARSRV